MLRDKVYKEFIEVREVFLLFNGLVGVNGGGGRRGSHFKEKIKERQKVYLFFCLFMFSEQNHLISPRGLRNSDYPMFESSVGLGSAVGLLHVRFWGCKNRISVSTFVSLTSTVQMRIKFHCCSRQQIKSGIDFQQC